MIATIDTRVDLLRRFFFSRRDVASVAAPWNSGRPCPVQVDNEEHLVSLLNAHVLGAAAPEVAVQYRTSRGPGEAQGRYHLGTYFPAPDGTTTTMCLDFDDHGPGALADPRSAAHEAVQRAESAGVPVYLESSKSGRGWHVWTLFYPPIDAALARQLGRAIAPEAKEIFPKQERVSPGGFGNMVWLPWWSGAPDGATTFYRLDGSVYVPEFVTFDAAPAHKAISILAPPTESAPPAPAPPPRAPAPPDVERDRREWRERALERLDLDAVYGQWLTGKPKGIGWLECRDPWSTSGDRDPSAGVADGSGEAERAAFHSFRSGETLSVFDFLIRHDGVDFKGAAEEIARLSSVPRSPAPSAVRQPASPSPEPTSDPWPDPLPLVDDLSPVPYPVDALPETIRAAVEEVQAFVQAPVALVVASALSAVSCAVQGLVDVARTETLKGPVSLYLLTIAESGERKSKCDDYFSRAIRSFEASQAELAAPEVARCRARHAAWEAEKSGVCATIARKAKTGAVDDEIKRRLEELEENEPQPHRYPRMLRGDSTQEHLAHALVAEWPSAGIISAEAGSIFGSHAMGRESVMRYLATLNALWSGEALRVGRRTSESFVVDGARLTVGLQVQPEVLANFIETSGDLARGSGFLARFLISTPESTQGARPFKAEPHEWVALDAFGRRVAALLGAVQIDEAGALRLSSLALGVAAKTAWVEFHDVIEAELRRGGELATVRDVASKAAENVARVAELFHVFEHGPTGTIDAPAVEAASDVVKWHLLESKRFFASSTPSPEQRDAAELEDWIINRCRARGTGQIPIFDIGHEGPNRFRKANARDAVLETLVALGRVRLIAEGSRRRVEVNPALLVDGVTP